MIEIDIHPNVFSGDFLSAVVISWHGFYSFVAVAAAVVLTGRWAPIKGLDPDAIYSIAIWAILGGVIGARLVHVIDHWDIYQNDPARIFAIWSGGIGLWGALLGGFIGGTVYAYFTKHPIGSTADMVAPIMPFGQAIGRIGDIINGEHCAKPLDLFFSMRWTNDESPAVLCANGGAGSLNSVHPVILYEIAWNVLCVFILWKLRGRLRPDGMLFATYLALYALGRFTITFFREDKIWTFGMQEAHYIAIIVLVITIPLLVVRARFTDPAPDTGTLPPGTRAERRRRS